MTQAAPSVITEEMRAAVGVEGVPVVMEVERANCRMFARAVGHTDPIFYDEQAARGEPLVESRRSVEGWSGAAHATGQATRQAKNC